MDEPPIPISADAETAHKIGHESVRSPRIEVITCNDRRRSWTLDQKREIVAESLWPALTPTEVARKHAISSGLLYTWRQQLLGGQMTILAPATQGFTRVEMTPAPQPPDAPDEQNDLRITPPYPAGLIQIVLPGGVTLRVDAAVDAAALGRVLAVLDQR
jgi:transposase